MAGILAMVHKKLKNCKYCNESRQEEFDSSETNMCKACRRIKRRQRYKEDEAFRIKKKEMDKDYSRRMYLIPEWKMRELERQRVYLNIPENREKRNTWRRAYRSRPENQEKRRLQRKNNIRIRLNDRMGLMLRRGLKSGKEGRHWESLVNFTIDELIIHLQKRFKDGMTWDNYGEWHIDHIIPLSVFNFDKPEDIDFKRCWDLKNLQPLWGMENIKKSNYLTNPFQPALRERRNNVPLAL